MKKIVTVGERHPRIRATASSLADDQVLVLKKVHRLKEISTEISRFWKTNAAPWFSPEDRILIKINLNTADPYPASTSPQMLLWLLDFLHDQGIKRIIVGDCSSLSALPTKKVARRSGLLTAIKGRAELLCFDEAPWVTIPINGHYLDQVTVPQITQDVDRIIALANLKTHHLATFSSGLKLGVGFMHPMERYALHRDHLDEKIAEISLAVPPDLTIIDGRRTMISGGPAVGQVEEAGIVIIGTNPMQVDAEACRQLHALKIEHGCLENFPAEPFAQGQLAHAHAIGLGRPARKNAECIVLQANGEKS